MDFSFKNMAAASNFRFVVGTEDLTNGKNRDRFGIRNKL